MNGIRIRVTDAVKVGSGHSDRFNSTSELTTTIGALSRTSIGAIRCGTNEYHSEVLNLSQIINVNSMLKQLY